jgi:hypothetical protein
LLISAPIVAPKWTNGPYCPTEPPAEIERIEANELIKPDLMSRGFFSEWVANITSGGPCHRSPRAISLKIPTIKPTAKGIRIIKSINSLVLVNKALIVSKFRSGFLKILVRNFTKLINPYTLTEVMIPIIEPKTRVIIIDKNIKLLSKV